MILSAQLSEVNGNATDLVARLTPRHLADLRRSGLSDKQIASCGFHSLQTAPAVQKILNWKYYDGSLGDCLCIPFLSADGKPTGYCRLKPDSPRKSKSDGKIVKYESPKGMANRAYIPPGTWAALRDSSAPLVITEGEKKAAAADQHGFACVGLVGVYGWQKKRAKDNRGKPFGDRELIDDLASVPLQGRIVYLCFDSDVATNPNVWRAEWHLAEALSCNGAIVKVICLPAGEPGPNGKPDKIGLDDYLIVHGPEAFRQMLAEAVDPTPPEKGLVPNEAPDDPHRLARIYRNERCQHAEGLTLRFYREEWHRWDGSAYRVLPVTELRAELTASAKAEMDQVNLIAQKLHDSGGPPPKVRKISNGLMNNIGLALESMTVCPGTVEPPAWWDGETWNLRNLIALSNGLLDLDALFADKSDVLLPHTPRWFSPVCLPYPFDIDADCPRWQATLARILEADSERIALLQEWFGLCLTPDTSRQKFVVLEGEGANGKSVVCAALEAMLGSPNCSHVPLEVFGERFQLTPTIGKLANIATEVGELDKAAEGFLKSFTSGDPMQFDRKHKPPIQSVPTARLVLATNNRPRFSDRSGGLWRRMILMPFRVTIPENDPGRIRGMDKPDWWIASGDLPGILNWALAGLDRLRREDRFTRSEICEQTLAEYRTENNPARMFLLEMCREDPQEQAPCGKLYRAYTGWCNANGYSPLADRSFGKEVRRVFPKMERREIGPRGSRLYAYCGLAADLSAGFGG
jgi:P4 family phage/plasmid primase-like protien